MYTLGHAGASRGAAREMPRTPVRRVAQESVSWLAWVPWCSSCKGLIGERVRCTGEAYYFGYYKRLGPFAKLATSSLSREPYEAKVCAAVRGTESLTQSR